jgi:predicted RNA-binding Zn-ribbon protein involved in translation (DUF1610 family)
MAEQEVLDPEEEEEVRHLPAVRASEAIVARAELSVDEVVAQKDKILDIMKRVMKEGVHYGLIPGVNKPSLFKPGAEAINVALRLSPNFESERIFHDDGHLTVISKCTLQHITTGLVLATGEGLCTTKESRYAYRKAQRACPNCGEPQIKRSKFKPKSGDYDGASEDDEPGWYCWKKEGGCGMNFSADDTRITSQEEGKVPNADIADTYNTVLKMANKRSLVAAVLNGTAASDVFTQDVEDTKTARGAPEPEAEEKEEAKPAPSPDSEDFDPAKDLHPDAIQGAGKEAVDVLELKLRDLNDLVDWKAIIGAATKAHFDKASYSRLTRDEKDEWWVRLRNAVAKLEEVSHPDLGASPEYIRECFAWAFGGVAIEVTMLPPVEPAGNLPDDEIPFGE